MQIFYLELYVIYSELKCLLIKFVVKLILWKVDDISQVENAFGITLLI